MTDAVWFMLPAILLLGVTTSWEDFREGKIRNRWVLAALGYALLAYVLLFLLSAASGKMPSWEVLELFTNMGFAVVLGFGLWAGGLWTSGDGKLFIAFAALVPVSVYSRSSYPWIPSLTLVINIFVVSLAVMLAWILRKHSVWSIKGRRLLKEVIQLSLLRSVLLLFAISWLVSLFLSLIGVSLQTTPLVLVTWMALSLLQRKAPSWIIYPMAALAVCRLVFDHSVFSLSFVMSFALLVLGWVLIRSLLVGALASACSQAFTKEIPVSSLRPGMKLADSLEAKKDLAPKVLKALRKQSGIQVIRSKAGYIVRSEKKSFTNEGFLKEEPEGLNSQQVNRIQQLGVKKIRVSETVSFAPFIFAGVLMTLLVKGNVLILLQYLT